MEFNCNDCKESFNLNFYESLTKWPVKCIKCKSSNVNYSYSGSISKINHHKDKEEIVDGNI
jgi:hypothetical protein